jgi:hypothetical protein
MCGGETGECMGIGYSRFLTLLAPLARRDLSDAV